MAHKTQDGLTIATPQVVDAPTYVRSVSKFFCEAHPEYLPCKQNMDKIRDYFVDNGLEWNAANLEMVYNRVKDDLIPPLDILKLEDRPVAEVKKIYEKYGTPRYEFGRLIGYDLPAEWTNRPRTNGAETPRNSWISNDTPVPKSVLDEKISQGTKLTAREYQMLSSRQLKEFLSQHDGRIPDYLVK